MPRTRAWRRDQRSKKIRRRTKKVKEITDIYKPREGWRALITTFPLLPESAHADHQRYLGCPDGKRCRICHPLPSRELTPAEVDANLQIEEAIEELSNDCLTSD